MRVEIRFHGIEHEQYFQGVSMPKWGKDLATGIGESYSEAIEDALEQLASNLEAIPEELLNEACKAETGKDLNELDNLAPFEAEQLHSDECMENGEYACDHHYYASVIVGD
jgi:hypothetical protein